MCVYYSVFLDEEWNYLLKYNIIILVPRPNNDTLLSAR